jgi:phosphatidylglycerophosphatase A
MKFIIVNLIITFLNVGNIEKAPGTMGSLMAIPLFVLLNLFIVKSGNVSFLYVSIEYLIILLLLYFLAKWAITIYIMVNKKDDPSECVIDEVIGQLIAYMLPTLFLPNSFNQETINWLYITLPFILFRFFDIKKPNLIGYFDRNWHNANGIILDDVVAGIYAGCVTLIIIYLINLI